MSARPRKARSVSPSDTAKFRLADVAAPETANEAPAPYTVAKGSLRGRTWKRFLRGPDSMLLDDLYVPALSEALRYDRCCAYFSSSVLAAAARGFGPFIQRLIHLGQTAPRPAARLVVNEEMAREDVKAMIETGDTSKLEMILTRRFKDPKDVLERQRLAMLGWLVKEGLLDVRVGVMRHGGGIVHAKFGIVTDELGDAIVFCGSGNESGQGLTGNYEQVEVSTSWEDPARYRHYGAEEFESLWSNTHADVHTVTLPEALRLKLLKYALKSPPAGEPSNALARQKAAMIWRFIVEAPYLPEGGAACDATALVDLWPHQRRVVEETAAAWPEAGCC
nr:phospholipase D-like domain-containing protein [Candidatus Brocadiia bacterium]